MPALLHKGRKSDWHKYCIELKLRLVNVSAVTNVTGARVGYTERDVVLHVETDEISFHI